MQELLAKAIMIASVAFATTFDKGGKPYILHCLWVMNQVRHLGMDYMIVAVLHDLVEDTDWTIEQLRMEEFPEYILKSIDVLTHKEGVSYDNYIKLITTDEIAIDVKLRDLKHNSDITRLKDVRKKDFDRLEKYAKAFKYLS